MDFNPSLPQIPRCLQIRTVTKNLISFDKASQHPDYRIAAHVMIWTPKDGRSDFGLYRANIMMHLRFDGTFGFPGGIVEGGEDILNGLNRELSEEIGWDLEECRVAWKDYYCSQVDHLKKLLLHFFITHISMEQYENLERRCLGARDFGNEVLGTVRVPLYVMANKYGGLPAFLNNRFVGSAKQQLLLAFFHKKILTETELEEMLYFSQNMKLASNQF